MISNVELACRKKKINSYWMLKNCWEKNQVNVHNRIGMDFPYYQDYSSVILVIYGKAIL